MFGYVADEKIVGGEKEYESNFSFVITSGYFLCVV